MAFQLAFPLPGPIEITDFISEEDGVVTVDLGDDPDLQRSFILFVSLQPMPMGIPGEMELAFWIADYDPASGEFYKYWHGNETKSLIPDPTHREVAVFLICRGTERLVQKFNPRSVFVQTMAADLPERAYKKYMQVCETLVQCGYGIHELEPYHGRRSWLAERP